MRICLASIHPRLMSGQIESLIALQRGLKAQGHSVEIVSAFPADQLGEERRWAIEAGDGRALIPKVVRIGGIVGRIASAAHGCDVLHLNVPTPAFGVLADTLQIATRRPLVVGFEAHLASVPAVAARLLQAPEFYGPRIVVNNGLVSRITLRRAQRYVVSSEYQRRELLALGYDGSRVRVIPNLIDEDKLRRWDSAEARRALGLPNGRIVAFVGHYHDVKGHDVLIDAFRRIRTRVADSWLVLGWSGIGSPARVHAAIERAGIGDRVIELGRLDVGQLFSAADVVALPCRFTIGQEAFPGTVIEAMWIGAPLVTSELPLLAELADQGANALLAPPGDAAALADEILRLLADKALAAQIVAAQRAAVAERFSAERRIHDYIATYEAALAGQARIPQPAHGFPQLR
jgi:glycosyltransferase involved in cell wall biosynthesis